ncbi:uncharacterized protein LOC106668842 isoform X1 [Cimex lectularius]|uniref:PH domain-containing protein n=1 Tax=Cimex lectularius TaxID=79782 RepID=A0A8I6S0A7_CIMLE|nr:uncharacterized protein LOC106668842 isoform X1 [Cimex lectularius]
MVQLDTPEVSEDSSLQSSVVSAGREMHAIKRGLLWQQRDRIFSRWKERYFILTKDYLHCFKRSSGLHNISPMGQFIFKVKLVELEKVEWLNKKSYSAIGLALQGRESKILLRAPSGLEDWFELLEECTIASKERRIALRKLHDPNWGSNDGPYSRTDWISNSDSHRTDSASLMESVLKRRSRCGPEIDLWPRTNHENRLSLLTDIDINSWGSTPPPSAPSTFRGRPYRFNTDVFFLPQGGNNTATMSSGRSLLTPVASFRNGQFPPHNHHNLNTTSINNNGHPVRYRERSQSDALNKIRAPDIENKRASYVSTVISQI